MERKTLEDFNNDYQAYANYLESAECMQDDGIDVYAEGRNVYTPTNGDWREGHGHFVDNTGLNKKILIESLMIKNLKEDLGITSG